MRPEEIAELGGTGGQADGVPTLRADGTYVAPTNTDEDRFENYTIMPQGTWPPPMYLKKAVSPDERFYMEHRWHSQWSFFDKKATENKALYLRYQWIIGVGSVAVPVLVGINPTDTVASNILYFLTVGISLAVAISAAIENIYKYGDNWRSYRQAAEELKQEKSLYDAQAGRYGGNRRSAFVNFVERCEEICAQQNGRWVQSVEKQQAQAAEQIANVLDKYQAEGLPAPGISPVASAPKVSGQGLYEAPQSVSATTPEHTSTGNQWGGVLAGAGVGMAGMAAISSNGDMSQYDASQYDVPMGDYDVPMGDIAQYDVPMSDYDVPMGDIAQYDVPMGDYDVPMGDISDHDVSIDEESLDIG